MVRLFSLLAILIASNCGTTHSAEPSFVRLEARPAHVTLTGPTAIHMLLVDGVLPADAGVESRKVDVTSRANFRVIEPAIVTVSDRGEVRPLADGETTIAIEFAGRTTEIRVTVARAQQSRQYHFENDILPVLTKFGCNASGCHGKAEGQNGFKLSIFGFDPAADYDALTKEGRGRRVFPAGPHQSLLLTKASGGVPHGGGVRILPGSEEYATLLGWIAAGLPFGEPTTARIASISLTPRERVLDKRGQQQLRVVARFTDGREVDVTRHAKYQSNHEGLATVDEQGLVSIGEAPGVVAIMASYLNEVATFQAIIPRAEPLAATTWPENNFIDPLVYKQLAKLAIEPSAPASDEVFLRRAYLDVIGTLPTADEVRSFARDERPDRRAIVIESLLARPEFNDFWALRLADILRVDRPKLGHRGAHDFYRWIHESLAAHMPLDQFARALITADGPFEETPAANFYRVAAKPGEAASTVSQVLLGVRIACAECHHHPSDRWSQDDYYGMTAFFTPLSRKKTPLGETLLAAGNPTTKHPRSGKEIFAYALGQTMPTENPAGDRRRALADWLTAADNPWFARNFANRIWAYMLGRGLVEPVDDVRATNPPSNPALYGALAKHLAESKFDLRALVRTIANSHVYQLSSEPNATNELDEQNYSRALWKRLEAEVLLDAVCQTTGVPEKFELHPPGLRAIQLWDSQVDHYFLKLFGRPLRVTACTCERNAEASIAQVLHLMNSPEVQHKLEHEAGRIAELVRREPRDPELIEELYLTFFSRRPTAGERQAALAFLAARPSDRRRAVEDLAWSMLNTLEFVFNR